MRVRELETLVRLHEVKIEIEVTHPDLDVTEFQVSISQEPPYGNGSAVGRSSSLNRALDGAARLYRRGRREVWQDKRPRKDRA